MTVASCEVKSKEVDCADKFEQLGASNQAPGPGDSRSEVDTTIRVKAGTHEA